MRVTIVQRHNLLLREGSLRRRCEIVRAIRSFASITASVGLHYLLSRQNFNPSDGLSLHRLVLRP